MEERPLTFDAFIDRFLTEKQCRDYLYRVKWPDGFVCPKCGYQKSHPKREGGFRCAACDSPASVTAGTAFQGSKLPLQTWFRLLWWVSAQKNGVSAVDLQRVFGLSYPTARKRLQKIRAAMLNPDRGKLSGTVEVDEAYIGPKRKGTSGRGAAGKSIVVVAAEKRGDNALGRIRMKIVPSASKENLQNFIMENVEPGSTLITDGCGAYRSIREAGYRHIVNDKSSAVTPAEAAALKNDLPLAHLAISLVKRWLLCTFHGGTQEEHLQSYLDEFVFRFNRRQHAENGRLFYYLLECMVKRSP
jgi:transposase-like protein